jgi:eukaryotic-like serine/threonine-protein kinase
MAEPASLGPYELVARLGVGGMAEVWKATAHGVGGFARTVVVKRILPHLAGEQRFIALFLAEARLSALLHHANIVDVFACGELDGRYYMAMEYVHGCDLHRLLRAHAGAAGARAAGGPPHPGLAAFVMREVCRALAYAHALTDERGEPLGLVHRDVSLSNVMVSQDGAVKLLDFGIAKALGALRDRQTRVTRLAGKRGYLAPEALQGRAIDARADQFSAGVVMHELLTGTRLFAGWEPGRSRGPVAPPSHANPRVPPELDRVCLRALEADRERRFASCDEMAVELDRAAHRLEWGPQQLAELIDRLLPDVRTPTPPPQSTESLSQSRSGAPPTEPPPTTEMRGEVSADRSLLEDALVARDAAGDRAAIGHARPFRWRRVALSASTVAMVAALAWLLARAPAPVAPPPPLAAPGVTRADAGAPKPPNAIVVTPLPTDVRGQRPPPPPPSNARPRPKPGKRAAPPEPNLLDGEMLNPFPR